MEEYYTKSNIARLKDAFPTIKKNIRSEFKYKNRKGGTGSGFLNTLLISRAEPIYTPPITIFSLKRTSVKYTSSFLQPGNVYTFTGYGSFILQNETDDTTYDRLQWNVNNSDVSNNQQYTIKVQNDNLVHEYNIALTTWNRTSNSTSYMKLIVTPGTLNNNPNDNINTMTVHNGDIITFTYTNTSTLYTDYEWSATGITLPTTGTTVTGAVNIIPNNSPVVVTLKLYEDSMVIDTLTHTTNFNVLQQTASINNNINYTTSTNVEADSIIPFTFNNTSTGVYSNYIWTATGITLPTTGTTVTGNVTVNYPTTTPVVVTLTLLNNDVIVSSTTYTVNFIVSPPIASINNDIIDTTQTINSDEFENLSFSFSNTTQGIYDYEWSATGITLPTTGTTVTGNVTVNYPTTTPVVVTLKLKYNSAVIATRIKTINFTSSPAARFQLTRNGTIIGTSVNIKTAAQATFIIINNVEPTDIFVLKNLTPISFWDQSEWNTGTGYGSYTKLENDDEVVFTPFFAAGYGSPPGSIPPLLNDAQSIWLNTRKNGILQKTTYMRINFNRQPLVVSIDNVNSDSAIVQNVTLYQTVTISLNNTSTGLFISSQGSWGTNVEITSFQWSATGITLPTTGTTVTGNVTIASNQPPVVVTLRAFNRGVVVGTRIKTINFNVGPFTEYNTAPYASSMILWYHIPQPQTNTGVVSGLTAQIVPSRPGTIPYFYRINFNNGDSVLNITTPLTFTTKPNQSPELVTLTWNGTPNPAQIINDFAFRPNPNPSNLVAQGSLQSPARQLPLTAINQVKGTREYNLTIVGFGSPIYEFIGVTQPLDTSTAIVYKTSLDFYFSNSANIPYATISTSTSYFDNSTGRYNAQQNGLADVTFSFPLSDKYVMFAQGGITSKKNNTTNVNHYNTGIGSQWASLHDITTRVTTNTTDATITFLKTAGAQGQIYGFFCIKYNTI